MQALIYDQDKGEIIMGTVIQWLQDNAETYFTSEAWSTSPTEKSSASGAQFKDTKFSRMWIYSHHLYSKIKRKDILEFTAELNLTGFSMPGKPGMIVVEGYNDHVEEFWGRIRRMQWKKITMKEKEDTKLEDKDVDSLRKFPNFEEKGFDAKPGRGREIRMDKGLLYQYLNERGCGHIFYLFFGVDGKSAVAEDD